MNKQIGIVLLLVVIVYVGLVVVSGEDVFERLPSWVYERQQIRFKGFMSSGEYTGRVNLTYDILDAVVDDFYNGTGYLYYKLKARMISGGYGGVLGFFPGFPAVYFDIELNGYLSYNVDLHLSDGRTINHGKDMNLIINETIVSFYHPGDRDKLYAVLKVYQTGTESGGAYEFVLIWYRKIYNETTNSYDVVELDRVHASATYESIAPLVIKMGITPVFYELDSGNESYLVYGYRGNFTVSCIEYCAVDYGSFEFAWTSKNITNTTDLTELDIKKFVEDLMGWYVWVGLGIEYYEPGVSPYERFPKSWENRTYEDIIGVNIYDSSYTGVSIIDGVVRDMSYRVEMFINEIYGENWVVDAPTIYALFISGGLDKYKEAYMNIVDNTNSYYYRTNFLLGLLPYVLAGFVMGWAWRINPGIAGIVFLVVLGATGVMVGIWSYIEVIVISMVLVVVFMYKLYNEG